MKRYNNLYDKMCKKENIEKVFKEVCSNTKNKAKVQRFKEYKCINITRIKDCLEARAYVPGPYRRFTIYEPKERQIVSQGMFDKAINHLVGRYVLLPSVGNSLIDSNVASRINMGTSYGIKLFQNYKKQCNIKYKEYYILKCDISKFFFSIDKEILKEKLKKKIKDKDALKITFDIIDSEENGLGIGNMTSQILAIFYLSDMDHYIKEKLKIKYYVRYQDDFVLFHESKEYLKYCLEEIKKILDKEHLKLNKKTRIYKNTNNFIFLGRDFNNRYARYRRVRRKLNKRYKMYLHNEIRLDSMASSIICYDTLLNNKKMLVL